MSSESNHSTNEESEPEKKRGKFKTARPQHFSEKWLRDVQLKKWISRVPHRNDQAKCLLCNKIMCSKYSVLISHQRSVSHQKKASSVCKTNCQVFETLAKKTDEDIEVKNAVLRNCLLIVEHDVSFRTINHIVEVQKQNFKDSKIAPHVILKRTKCTAIVKNVLAEVVKTELAEAVKDKKISILLDESTDISCKKLLAILVKYVDSTSLKTVLLDLMEVNDATAKGLYMLLKNCLDQFHIDVKNIIGYCADNANVMMGSKESVKQYLLNGNKSLITNGCICHTIHLVVVSAAKHIPDNVESLLQNVSTYFSRSPKRQQVLEEFQNFMNREKLKILKPSATRWLALSNCVERILSMWDVLLELFRVADFEKESEVATVIFNCMSNPIIKAYLLFLKYILPMFNKFNAFFQSEKILIHLLYKECLSFLKSLSINFVKPENLKEEKLLKLNILHPDNLKPIENVVLGDETLNLISSFQTELKLPFVLNCLKFYQTAFQECIERFPLNEFYKNLEFVCPDKALGIGTMCNLNPIFKQFEIKDSEVCLREYLNIKVTFNNEEIDNLKKMPILEFWENLKSMKNWNEECIFENISELALNVLSLPHGNADVERTFSIINEIKTKKRNKLKTDTLTALVRIRLDLLSKNSSCFNFKFNKGHYIRLNKDMYHLKTKKDEMEVNNDSDDDWLQEI